MIPRLQAIAFIGAVAAPFTVATADAAPITYPWCTSGAMQEYGAVNCGFSTFEQCLATARGNGQSCGPNPFYEPPTAKPRVAVKKSRRIKSTSR